MKVKVSKNELRECIETAVRRALNERAENGKKIHRVNEGKGKHRNLNEFVDDEDVDDLVTRFLRNPKNQLPKRMKGGSAARKAAMADIKSELDSEKKDDETVSRHEREDRPDND